jgi:hypothetical protein
MGGVKNFLRILWDFIQMTFFLAKLVKIMRPMPTKRGVIISVFLMIPGRRLKKTPKNKNTTPQIKRPIWLNRFHIT